MLDLLLISALGFLGSFGHCVGMCGPLTVAFSLSGKDRQDRESSQVWQQHLYFHALLNIGRIFSYVLVGAAIGAIGSVLIASGQLAGIESDLRRWLAILTGILLVWMGLVQIEPEGLPQMPFLNPIAALGLHQRLSNAMMKLSLYSHPITPALLGMTWGLIPCGFLYTAQLKAAETSSMMQGALTMLAFGIGTLPSMLGIGIFAGLISRDRRSQLFRMGGWITLTIGLLTILRSSDMVDYTGHGGLILLVLALVARPLGQLSKFWSALMTYRRAIGMGAFILSIAHTFHMLEHTFQWNFDALSFLIPRHQLAIWLGAIAIALMTPAAITSSDWMVAKLGKAWRYLHLLSVPALVLASVHTIAIGSSYLGAVEWSPKNWILTISCGAITAIALSLRMVNLKTMKK
ncbi:MULTISPECIES: sulfite exporter TauE/SafE family protein [Pseudanabaena]|uniref:Ferric reductase domain protein transmembrane component domain n=2 Tax=Pseudanabaena TaxID=1152 RepID=L8N996_9CYAN|nr:MULTISPECIES: sulfite exporter TauE/SafE family protein [Pseudanabaena]ELS34778.1 Ferric reductase domain protein transmembrane component domain [Pseudanabaena biceps PCC 7429]MDG3493015.1 sulfite exporter TauE/SafE family protein [Pseudanabaena catenata USMAC16]